MSEAVARVSVAAIVLLVLGVSVFGQPGAAALQATGPSIDVGAVEPRAEGLVVPVALTSPTERVGAIQFEVDNPPSAPPVSCEIPTSTPGLTGSCRVGSEVTRFSVFTLQGLDPGTTRVGLLVVGSPTDAPASARITTVVDPSGTRLAAPAPPASGPSPEPDEPLPTTGSGGALSAPAIVGDTTEPGTTPVSPAIGAGVPLITAEAPPVDVVPPEPVVPAEVVVPVEPVVPPEVDVPPEPEPSAEAEPVAAEPETSASQPGLPVAIAAVAEPRPISFVGPSAGALRGSPWGFASTVDTRMATPAAVRATAPFGPSPEFQAAATAVLGGCLLGGAVLVANRRVEPAAVDS